MVVALIILISCPPCIHSNALVKQFNPDDTESCMTSRWQLDEKHIGQKLKKIGKKMQLASKQIIVLNFSGFDTKQIITLSVDCVNYPTTEFRLDPGVEWFDHKSHGPGLKYEYALSVHHVSASTYL